ncbi:MAG: YggS family pyridoxal phosphate-dependent enzyme [Sulfurospirillum sp.]|nr:YggS family pyridoxal phosphate-dependent enzyme [Sulfurospirillum sp.]
MSLYEERFDVVLSKIEKVRLRVNQHQIIKIIAVSKSVDADAIKKMYAIGQRAFGENRVQDLKIKTQTLDDLPLEWHFIGRLQTNKINQLIDLEPALMHSCDSLQMACELDNRLSVKEKSMDVLLQINSAYEEQKAGVLPEKALETYEQILLTCKHINLKGVMSIGAHVQEEKIVQKSFETTYKIFEKLSDKGAIHCSMGMSSDFELAVACGANMLRIGSTLFH